MEEYKTKAAGAPKLLERGHQKDLKSWLFALCYVGRKKESHFYAYFWLQKSVVFNPHTNNLEDNIYFSVKLVH
jgi:hypothetical protein